MTPIEAFYAELEADIWARFDKMMMLSSPPVRSRRYLRFGELWVTPGPNQMHHILHNHTRHEYPLYEWDTRDELIAAAIESHEWFERNYG